MNLPAARGPTILTDALSQTDTSRAQNLELAVQARVAEELKRLQAQESANLKAILDEASEAAEKEGAQKGKDDQKQLSSHAVSKEVEALRARLDKRKQLRELPESVEKARSSVISCLRENDRRPLNCWEEIEAFKDEVRKLEKGWVDRVVR